MVELELNGDMINKIKKEAADLSKKLMGEDLIKVILYGSCARGDYTPDSDIDVALITRCDRMEAKKYSDGLAAVSTKLAMQYFSVVNFVCLPYDEFLNKKLWYVYFQSIDAEGEVLYG